MMMIVGHFTMTFRKAPIITDKTAWLGLLLEIAVWGRIEQCNDRPTK